MEVANTRLYNLVELACILLTALACLIVVGTSMPYLWMDFFNLDGIEAKIASLFLISTKVPSTLTKGFDNVFPLM